MQPAFSSWACFSGRLRVGLRVGCRFVNDASASDSGTWSYHFLMTAYAPRTCGGVFLVHAAEVALAVGTDGLLRVLRVLRLSHLHLLSRRLMQPLDPVFPRRLVQPCELHPIEVHHSNDAKDHRVDAGPAAFQTSVSPARLCRSRSIAAASFCASPSLFRHTSTHAGRRHGGCLVVRHGVRGWY